MAIEILVAAPRFSDRASALELLRSLKADSFAMAGLRHAMQGAGGLPANTLNDDDVLSAAALRLVRGELVIGRRLAPILPHVAAPEKPAEAPPPPAPPPVRDQATPSRIDVVIPVEMDLDDDPATRDELRLRALDGSYEKVLRAGDADAARDEKCKLHRFRFRDVPAGAYAVSAKVGDRWCQILSGLRVSDGGVHVRRRSFKGALSHVDLGNPRDDPSPAEPQEEIEHYYVDQDEDLYPEE